MPTVYITLYLVSRAFDRGLDTRQGSSHEVHRIYYCSSASTARVVNLQRRARPAILHAPNRPYSNTHLTHRLLHQQLLDVTQSLQQRLLLLLLLLQQQLSLCYTVRFRKRAQLRCYRRLLPRPVTALESRTCLCVLLKQLLLFLHRAAAARS